ncbi:MAG TPA: protein kinase [Chthoniobacterales bacterium]|nr:protein kinase [Chthoniobacterales bacterium]
MQFDGLTDFPTGYIDSSNQCACGSVARVGAGLCAKCLVETSLDGDHLDELSFELRLDEVDVPDRDWRLGNYQIIEEIARGGMGVVYRARHLPSQRIVALKRVLTYHSDSQETLARFQREAQAAASLEHPNILPIYDVGITEDSLPYFSMKLAAGGSLQNIKGQFANQFRRSAELLVKVTRAIHFAHQNGVIHRDLKPGNILLDGAGDPMVADFGLAKWLDRGGDLTCTLTVFGTPGYIAPEQAQSSASKQNAAVDIYSLGAIFFELLSGRPPFLGEHALDVIRQATDKPAPKLRALMSNAPRDLETICSRCLDRDPARRYPSAAALAADIQSWVEDRPIVARPLSRPTRLWRWARHNRALAGSLCACIGLACAAIVWQFDNLRLGKKVRTEQLAAHSIAVLPFLNLDDGSPDFALTSKVADSLRHKMSLLGPVEVQAIAQPAANWTGTGTSTEIKSALEGTHCRVALVGMYRRSGGHTRFSMRFVPANGSGAFHAWTTQTGNAEDVVQLVSTSDVSTSVYRILDNSEIPPDRKTDPALTDATARAYYQAGRLLLERRTLADINRAIGCFENAIAAAPRSTLARSYLVLALTGKNFLAADAALIDRAYATAREALEISPDDSNGHRALCALDILGGHFDEALDHGFRALELSDPTERVLGQIAYLWKELGRPDKSIQWFAKAKASQEQHGDYDALVGDAWALLAEDEKAAAAYQKASSFKPDLPDGWLGLCHLKLLQGRLDEARILFNQRVGEYSGFHNTRWFGAQLELFARNFSKAQDLYSEILKADPNGVSAEQYGKIGGMSGLARSKMGLGDANAANDLLRRCIAHDEAELVKSPKHPEILYRLAANRAMQGNAGPALAYLKASIAAGYIDYRSIQSDPRFDGLTDSVEFQKIVSELAANVANLRQQSAVKNPNPTGNPP